MNIYKINNNIREKAILNLEETWSWINFFFIMIVILVSFTFVRETMYMCVQVEGTSMSSTLEDKDYLLLDKRAKITHEDVIVFYYEKEEKLLIKRVIGLPGDVVWTENGIVHRIKAGTTKEEVLTEAYVDAGKLTYTDYTKMPPPDLKKTTVKDDMLFVLGDNRTVSKDSRSSEIGLVPVKNVRGVVHQSIIDNKDTLWFLYKLF